MGQASGLASVSFSGPGTVITGYKLGVSNGFVICSTNSRYVCNSCVFLLQIRSGDPTVGMVIVPDYDVVPRVDVHKGAVQNILCGGASSALKCHSILRTCCELIRSCGDPYNRSLTQCTKYWSS